MLLAPRFLLGSLGLTSPLAFDQGLNSILGEGGKRHSKERVVPSGTQGQKRVEHRGKRGTVTSGEIQSWGLRPSSVTAQAQVKGESGDSCRELEAAPAVLTGTIKAKAKGGDKH